MVQIIAQWKQINRYWGVNDLNKTTKGTSVLTQAMLSISHHRNTDASGAILISANKTVKILSSS